MAGAATMSDPKDTLIAAARGAQDQAYAPYSNFQVGAALQFADGSVVTGCNVENASYGMTLCAETVAVAKAMADGKRGGLTAVAVVGSGEEMITPCGRCRQVLYELAGLGGTDPVIHCVGVDVTQDVTLSALLPAAFGPESLE